MNRIKIIKRADLQSPREARETETKRVNQTLIKTRAEKVIENWIDDWRASKMRDAQRASDNLFGRPPAIV